MSPHLGTLLVKTDVERVQFHEQIEGAGVRDDLGRLPQFRERAVVRGEQTSSLGLFGGVEVARALGELDEAEVSLHPACVIACSCVCLYDGVLCVWRAHKGADPHRAAEFELNRDDLHGEPIADSAAARRRRGLTAGYGGRDWDNLCGVVLLALCANLRVSSSRLCLGTAAANSKLIPPVKG